MSIRTALETADWRQRVFALYAEVRRVSEVDPAAAHAAWRAARDELFATHPATPLLPEDRASFRGLPVADYDPAWRFVVDLAEPAEPASFEFETGTDGLVPFELLGVSHVPGVGDLDVWRLASYGGGLFLPVKDGLAGKPGGTYGGGRYLLDTIKGAHLGDPDGRLVLDFNFAYNPSCAYDPAWACPLAPAGDTVASEIPVGERYEGAH
ncbi:hypothetical protein GCM10010988_33750 [Cnuibacter physcomitrellae]|uniref:Uncharacterized protein n=1 Tax=Cnuibacter physcomitrellae TaxID=1619308 RepID=A0A1X9LJA3_9MICO|nr:DUF1684 domain-containing protein [Cnuibacter physcomitrellae]ARJ04572.1 hypothetical protein B5808_04545 [Cnuibacter physcomitrellae]GGI41368.1 hypothetical protein GCM10010988_33750 [Cnuibacter physcomitrellae]